MIHWHRWNRGHRSHRPPGRAVPLLFPLLGLLLLGAAMAAPPGGEAVPPRRPERRPGPPQVGGARVDPMTVGAAVQGLDGRGRALFDGRDWKKGWITRDGAPSDWLIDAEGAVVVGSGDAMTNERFGDFQLHLEFWLPPMADATGQAKANSGLYLHGRYEIQILDSFGFAPAHDRCGGLYGQAAPLVNAGLPGGVWQAYDIVFRAPRLDASGEVLEKPRATVLLNGVVIHNNIEIASPTGGAVADDMPAEGPILLQDHGNAVRFRNIWIRPL